MVVEGVLEESRRFYLTQFDQVVGRLITMPKGSLRRQVHDGRMYWYLRKGENL